MPQLTQMDLDSLRHLISCQETAMNKYQWYAENCQDQSLKNQFQQLAQTAQQDYKKLLGFLS